MSSLDDIVHPPFEYVLIPEDISNPVVVLKFQGKEEKFKNELRRHFTETKFLAREKSQLASDLKDQTKSAGESAALSEEYLARAVELSETYQILPLTLPTKATNFEAVNAYIDNVGRLKNCGKNARASRVTNDDIRGDCFLSRTFDDDDAFKRIDFTMKDYEEFLENPPAKRGRWSQESALKQLMTQKDATTEAKGVSGGVRKDKRDPMKFCASCWLPGQAGAALLKCGGCGKVCYCTRECQKSDWKYHKSVCKPRKTTATPETSQKAEAPAASDPEVAQSLVEGRNSASATQ